MDLATVKKNAKERLQGYCRVCPVCDGRVCSGEVPGMGGAGTGSGFRANIESLAKYRFNMQTVHNVTSPDTSIVLWGERLSLPVLAAPMTGVSYNMGGKMTEQEFIDEVIAGCTLAGTVGMTGDGAEPGMYESGIQAIAAQKGKGIAIIKPRSQEEIIKRIHQAEAAGALALGMDIDGAGLITMALKGQPVSPKTVGQLKEVISATKLPFILKGIMTPKEAGLAVEAGAKGIVVSNHGGRVMDFTPGTAEVISGIVQKVKGKLTIFADGGVRTGADVLKFIALGADAVLVGRPLVVGAFGGNREGVALLLNKMKNELIQTMILTGTSTLKEVKRDILYN